MIEWIWLETCLGLLVMKSIITGMVGIWALNKYLKVVD